MKSRKLWHYGGSVSKSQTVRLKLIILLWTLNQHHWGRSHLHWTFLKFTIASKKSWFQEFQKCFIKGILVLIICSYSSSAGLPAGYTKCDLKNYGGLPQFKVSNQRAWANPTPTPWGRDSKFKSKSLHIMEVFSCKTTLNYGCDCEFVIWTELKFYIEV